MQANEILDRYSQIKDLASPGCMLEAVPVDSRIVFRVNRKTAVGTGVAQDIGFIGCAVVIPFLIYGLLPSPFSWLLIALLLAVLGWMVVGTRSTYKDQTVYFEIDTVQNQIIVPHYQDQSRQTINIADIQCFYTWLDKSGSDSYNSLHVVNEEDETTVLMQGEIANDIIEWNTSLLAFLCDKPARRRSIQGEFSELPPFTAESGK